MMPDERLMNFCRALSDTVRSGLALSKAFEILSRSPKYGRFIAGAAKLTAGGSTIGEALKAQNIFPPVFIALVRAGEEGGKVAEFLALYADCLQVRIEFRRRIARALVYPAFAVVISGALFLLILFKVIPLILGPLLSAGTAVPGQILRLNNWAGYSYKYWPPAVLFICFAALAFRALLRSGPGRKLCALAGHWLPVFRFAAGEARLYHIYTTIGLLLKAGIAPGAMMEILLQFSQDDPVTHRRFLRASALLSDGKSFSESLGGCAPPQDRLSLEIAEKAGRLDETLLRLGKVHYDRHLHRLKLLATGCKLSAIVAIVLLAFTMTLLLMRPILSVFVGVQKFSSDLPGLAAPLGQAPSPAGFSGGLQLPNSYVVGDKTAIFNTLQGKKIAELMQKSAPKAHISTAGAPQPEKPVTEKKKLIPVSPVKKFRLRKIEATPVKPTEIR